MRELSPNAKTVQVVTTVRTQDSELKLTLILVLQITLGTQIIHEVFPVLKMIVPFLDVILVLFSKSEALQTENRTLVNKLRISHQNMPH